MNSNAFSVLILVVFCCRGSTQSSASSVADSDPESRHAAYQQLNRQIYARHEDPGSGNLNFLEEKGRSATRQLQDMIAKEIDLALVAPGPSAKTISSAIAGLQGEMTLTGWGPEDTNTPLAKFFSLSGVRTLAVAYVIMQGGDAIPDTQPYMVLYDNASGVWAKKASAPTLADFEACTFSVAQLNSGVPGEAWFLAWGMPFGSSHGSEHARLYAFNGFTVRTIWKRDKLDGGRIKVAPDSVTLDYLDFDDPSMEHHEILHVTPNGLLPQ